MRKMLCAVLLGVSVMCVAQLAQAMVRQVFLFDTPDNVLHDRYYFSTHSQEVIRQYGPWLRRYWVYRLYDVPHEADVYNVRRGRMTDIWMESMEDMREIRGGTANYTKAEPLTGWSLEKTLRPAAIIWTSGLPSERFVTVNGNEPRLDHKHFLRWMVAVRYPKGVSFDEGEEWYLETHAKELMGLPGLLYFVSYALPDADEAMPAAMQAGYEQLGMIPHVRLSELWFESYEAWRKACIEVTPDFTPPPWAGGGSIEEIFEHMTSAFVGAWPDADFLHDKLRVP